MTDDRLAADRPVRDGPRVHRYGWRSPDELPIPFTTWTLLTATDVDGIEHIFHVPTAALPPCDHAAELERLREIVSRLQQALLVASHEPHDQAGDPVEGFPVCSVCGAIQTGDRPQTGFSYRYGVQRHDAGTLASVDRALAVLHREDDKPCGCDGCMSYGAEDEGFNWDKMAPARRIAIRILDSGDDRFAPIVTAIREHDAALDALEAE